MALPASLSGSDISLADVLREVSDIMSNPRHFSFRVQGLGPKSKSVVGV